MNASSVLLTDRFFAGYGLWQIVGVLGLLYPLAFVVYVLGTVSLCILLWFDRRSLLAARQLHAGLDMPRTLELEQTVRLTATLALTDANAFMPARLAWEA